MSLASFLESFTKEIQNFALAMPIIVELIAKLRTLDDLGLEYISLSRSCHSLSGGELQRLRLSAAMGSPLTGVMYIFDEPSAGLHPQDNELVLNKLRGLQERGNSVLMIEHDVQSIKFADHILDVGPYAGTHGGEIMYNGATKTYDHPEAPTGKALVKPVEFNPIKAITTKKMVVTDATKHTISDLSVTIPLHQLVVFGGVSGAGKSTLVHTIIAETLLNR